MADNAQTPGEPIVEIDGISKRFAGGITAVESVNLDIGRNEFFALLGPSGCGKTTLLRMIAGFEVPTEGRIVLDGQDMTGIQPNKRPVNMVFQSYAIFPHMTVLQNVAYGLKITGTPDGEAKARAQEALEMVQLKDFGSRKPEQLSGGQRQRVALARALVKRPKVLLLDEPLSALDKKLREDMQLELKRLQTGVGITFIIVTHDQEEAMSMASRIGVMEGGRVIQVGTPNEIYEKPASRFIADFIGSINLFEGKVLSAEAGTHVESTMTGATLHAADSANAPVGAEITLGVRPEKITLHATDPGAVDGTVNHLTGSMTDLSYFGDMSICHVRLDTGQSVKVYVANTDRVASGALLPGQMVHLTWPAASSVVL